MKIRLPLIIIFNLMVTATAVADEGFCLSGGFRNGYSCDVPLVAELDTDKVVFSIQVLEQGNNHLLSQRNDVTHISELEGGKRLVYLGAYRSQPEGMQALQRALESYGLSSHPMLVELTPSERMPKIRFVAEPNIRSSIALSDRHYSRDGKTYAIQLGAFSRTRYARQFSQQLGIDDLLCRQKDNGIYAVYYRNYGNYEEATSHLNDYAAINKLGAYVVALPKVSFSPCDTLVDDSSAVSTVVASAPSPDGPDSQTPSLSKVMTSSDLMPELATGSVTKSSDATAKVSPLASQQYSSIYSIQLAVFKGPLSLSRFVRRFDDMVLSCRTKDNGLLAVYAGAFESSAIASDYLQEHSVLQGSGAYVVKLRDVTFSSCP